MEEVKSQECVGLIDSEPGTTTPEWRRAVVLRLVHECTTQSSSRLFSPLDGAAADEDGHRGAKDQRNVVLISNHRIAGSRVSLSRANTESAENNILPLRVGSGRSQKPKRRVEGRLNAGMVSSSTECTDETFGGVVAS